MKQKSIFAKKCDWCKTELILNGKDSDTYVVNAEHKHFCKIHTPGKDPEKDCMDEYIKDKKSKTFLVRGIPADKWEQFKIKAIQKGTTCNNAMLELINRYSK